MGASSSPTYQCSETAGTMLDAYLSGMTVLINMPTNSEGYGKATYVFSVNYRESQEESYFEFSTRYGTFYAYSRDEHPTTTDSYSGGEVK